MKLLVAIFVNFSTAPSQESFARIQSVSIPLFYRPVDRWTVGDSVGQRADAGEAALHIPARPKTCHHRLKPLMCGIITHHRASANRRRRARSLCTATVVAAAQGLAAMEQLGYTRRNEAADSSAHTHPNHIVSQFMWRPRVRRHQRRHNTDFESARVVRASAHVLSTMHGFAHSVITTKIGLRPLHSIVVCGEEESPVAREAPHTVSWFSSFWYRPRQIFSKLKSLENGDM